VAGRKREEHCQCPACGTTSRFKSNRAVAKERERLWRRRQTDPAAPACRNAGCRSHGLAVSDHLDLYQRFGTTKGGDPRWRCKAGRKVFSAGKPARRHERSDKNRLVLEMLCNDLSIAKVSKISGLAYRDIYRGVDFFHDQVRSFVARREDPSGMDFSAVGSCFAPDSQALTVNWPTRRRRLPVVFQHLCTAHARSGFIVEAAFQLDPAVSPAEAEAAAAAAQEDHLSFAFREHARLWTRTKFDAKLPQIARNAGMPVVMTHGLPQPGSMIRYDIMQPAHAMRLRDHLAGTDAPLVFVMDGDAGPKQAFTSAFQPEVSAGRAHLSVVAFDMESTRFHGRVWGLAVPVGARSG
jgi:transposase-like protein